MVDFLVENWKLLFFVLIGFFFYLYFLYGLSFKFWIVKLCCKNLIFDIYKKNEIYKLFIIFECYIL